MSEREYTVDKDLKEARAMVNGLEDYVRGDELYVNIGGGLFGGGNMPMLTVGALVMRLRRLHALADAGKLNAQQQLDLKKLDDSHEAVRRAWTHHYEQKMKREINSRLDAMKTFFEEASTSMKLAARVYLPEVLRRTIVEELLQSLESYHVDVSEERKKARATDNKLRQFTAPSPFVWDTALESVYPNDRFWWMYVSPPPIDNGKE